jgi:hypothetical protein
MSDKIQHSHAREYRRQAQKARTKAARAADDMARAEFLQVADIWEQMAVWAETQGSNPPTEGDGSN